MDNRPLVSIIMPVYNIEKHLPGTLESVAAQTYPNIELILVDDGSSDSSDAICIQYAERNMGTRYIRQGNRGVSSARNRGIQEAGGDYLMFLDSDDLFEPEMVDSCVRECTSQKADLVIFGMFFDSLKDGALNKRTVRSHRNAILTQDNLKTLYSDLFRANYLTSSCNKLFSRSVIVDHHLLFDENLSNYEDLLFTLHCLRFTDKAVILSQPFYHYCRRRERHGLSGMYVANIADRVIYLITALQQQYAELELLTALPELTAHAQVPYVQGICNLCLGNHGIKEQATAISKFASNPVFLTHGIFNEQYGNRFTRLCRSLTLSRHWTLLVMVCRARNFIRRMYDH